MSHLRVTAYAARDDAYAASDAASDAAYAAEAAVAAKAAEAANVAAYAAYAAYAAAYAADDEHPERRWQLAQILELCSEQDLLDRVRG